MKFRQRSCGFFPIFSHKERLWSTFILFFAGMISVMFMIIIILSVKLLNADNCQSINTVIRYVTRMPETVDPLTSNHHLAILVPYRNRFEELLQFVPHINQFLKKQHIHHDIFVLNQADNYRFNRASLINVGYLQVKSKYDYIAMHDVDLLPLNDNLSYAYPELPYHLAAPNLHPRYHYAKFIGGILLINREQFALVNGLSNKYWGWGLEDDEFYVRLKEANLNITRPANISTGINNTFRHIHNKERKRDTVKCHNQREVTRKRDRQTGLRNIRYEIVDWKNMTIDEVPFTLINVKLHCDFSVTPWCNCIVKNNSSSASKRKGM